MPANRGQELGAPVAPAGGCRAVRFADKSAPTKSASALRSWDFQRDIHTRRTPLTEGRAKPTQRRLRDMDVAKASISTGTYCRGGPPGAWECAREVRLRRTRMSGQALWLLSGV